MSSERRTPKTLLTVSSLAERAGLSVHVVRLYLRRGLLRASRRTSAGYQLFDEDDAERLRFIRIAQRLGFTLAEIGEIVRLGHKRESPCPIVRSTIQSRLDETRRELDDLQVMLERMQHAVALWNDLPDAVPTRQRYLPPDHCGRRQLAERPLREHAAWPCATAPQGALPAAMRLSCWRRGAGKTGTIDAGQCTRACSRFILPACSPAPCAAGMWSRHSMQLGNPAREPRGYGRRKPTGGEQPMTRGKDRRIRRC